MNGYFLCKIFAFFRLHFLDSSSYIYFQFIYLIIAMTKKLFISSKQERRSTYECVRCLKAFMNNHVSYFYLVVFIDIYEDFLYFFSLFISAVYS